MDSSTISYAIKHENAICKGVEVGNLLSLIGLLATGLSISDFGNQLVSHML